MEPLSLHDIHEKRGARFGELGGREVVLSYGKREDEYQAAFGASALADVSYRQLLRITGEDRASFLQGMVTNEVKTLPEGATTYTALVTAKGGMIADARIWCRKGELLLDVEPGLGDRVREHLAKYVVSEEAEISDATGSYGLLWLLGLSAPNLLNIAFGAKMGALGFHQTSTFAVDGHEVTAVGSNLLVPGSLELLVPRAVLGGVFEGILERTGSDRLLPVGFETLEVFRVHAGVPRYGQDMDEHTIPLEANLERAINYNKGCYIGQEVIARATFRGHVNRKLVGLLLGAERPALKSELSRGGKIVGWITSVIASHPLGQNVALGYVHRDLLEPGTELEIAGSTGKAVVHALPLVGWG